MGGADTGRVFLAGAVAGVCEGITVQPMEMVKTRFQINTGQPMQILPTMRAIVAEGGVRQLYRGGLPEIAGLVPRSSAMWSGYEFSRREMTKLNGGVCNTQIVAMAGVCGGICEATAFSPFQVTFPHFDLTFLSFMSRFSHISHTFSHFSQVVKVRLMAKEHLGVYRNTMDAVSKIVRSEGIMALTIGLGPTLWRNCVWDSIYLSGMYTINKHVPEPDNVVMRVIQGGVLGAFAGTSQALDFQGHLRLTDCALQARVWECSRRASTHRLML